MEIAEPAAGPWAPGSKVDQMNQLMLRAKILALVCRDPRAGGQGQRVMYVCLKVFCFFLYPPRLV